MIYWITLFLYQNYFCYFNNVIIVLTIPKKINQYFRGTNAIENLQHSYPIVSTDLPIRMLRNYSQKILIVSLFVCLSQKPLCRNQRKWSSCRWRLISCVEFDLRFQGQKTVANQCTSILVWQSVRASFVVQTIDHRIRGTGESSQRGTSVLYIKIHPKWLSH